MKSPTDGASLFRIEQLEQRTLLAATKIMPLGDSITEGLNGDATYRYWLWHQLQASRRDVDFVGDRRGVHQGQPRFQNFDQDHQAYSGIRADGLLGLIDQAAARHRPDIVLLHIGTNDLFHGHTPQSTIQEIGQIIDRLRAANPRVIVLLAKIIPSSVAAGAIAQFNQLIPDLAAAKNTSISRVIVVDQFTGFSVSEDTYDGIHADESGEKKLSARWLAALSPLTAPPLDPNPWLSDLPIRAARNGWGPVERNRSNGGNAANDGRSIQLNNRVYARGLGVHAMSDVRINLGGRHRLFTTDAGIDDEVGNGGSVIFRVYVDSTKVYDSGPVYGRTGTKSIRIDVTGARTLRLLVTDKGDGDANDHADWANARLFSIIPGSNGAGISALILTDHLDDLAELV